VNDTTSTPDEPEGQIVTDDQDRGPSTRPHPAHAGSTNGTPDSSGGRHEGHGPTPGDLTAAGTSAPAGSPDVQADATPPAGEETVAPAARGVAEAAAHRTGSAESTASADVTSVDPAEDTVSFRPSGSSASGVEAAKSSASRQPAAEPATPARGTPARGTPAASRAGAAKAFRKPAAQEEATANLRLPKPANGVASAGPQAAQPVGHRTDPAAIPQPGPSAATPPPWHRVPGQEPAPVLVDNGVAGDSMLDDTEGPTAFLRAPRATPDAEDRAQSSSTAAPSRSGRTRPPRQASLQLKRLDPWSVLKLALVLAVVLFFIWLVAVGVLYGVLDGIGVWDRLNGTYADLVSGEAPSGSPLISAGRVFGIAAVVGAINSLLFAVAVTVGAFVYNVSADLVGGIEVTLSERD
jgi:Transmembrane domain of unknown function (DUF3566)